MEFEIESGAFADALRILAGVADRKSTMPVLANVLLRCDGVENGLLAVASELTVTVAHKLQCKKASEGEITVDAHQLSDIVSAMTGDTVRVKAAKDLKVEVACGRSRFTLTGISGRDYPKLPEAGKDLQPVDAKTLDDVLEQGGYATLSTEKYKEHLRGAHLVCKDDILRVESTDGARAIRVSRPMPSGPTILSAIVPTKGVGDLRKLLAGAENVALGYYRAHLVAQTERATIWIKVIDGTFAPIDNIIRATSERKLVVPRQALADLVRRVALAAGREGHLADGVRVDFADNTIKVKAQSMMAIGDDSIECAFDGAPLALGVNARYLAEALDHLRGDEVTVELGDSGMQPLQLYSTEDPTALALIMPMAL